MTETQRARRGHSFYPPAGALPPLYATESTPMPEKLIGVHYFVGRCDWWLTELDPDTGIAFGYACLGDPQNAEWGYVSLPELEAITVAGWLVVERDLDWTPSTVAEAELPGRYAV